MLCAFVSSQVSAFRTYFSREAIFTHDSHVPAWLNSWNCNATEWQHSSDHEGLQKLDQCCPIEIQGQPQRCTTLVISDFLVAILEKEKKTGEINRNDVFNPIY